MAKIATFTTVRTRSKTCHLDMSFSFARARTKRRIGAQIVMFRFQFVFYTRGEISSEYVSDSKLSGASSQNPRCLPGVLSLTGPNKAAHFCQRSDFRSRREIRLAISTARGAPHYFDSDASPADQVRNPPSRLRTLAPFALRIWVAM